MSQVPDVDVVVGLGDAPCVAYKGRVAASPQLTGLVGVVRRSVRKLGGRAVRIHDCLV